MIGLPKLTLSEWKTLSEPEFSKIYGDPASEFQTLIRYVESRFRSEIINFVRKLSSKGDIFFALRIKSEVSTFNKIRSLDQVFRRRLDGQPVTADTGLYMFDLVPDLIGARIICIDEELRHLLLFDLVTSLRIQVEHHEIKNYKAIPLHFNSPVESQASDDPSLDVRPSVKESHYESIHLFANLGPAETRGMPPTETPSDSDLVSSDLSGDSLYDKYSERFEHTLLYNVPARLHPMIPSIPVEIQLRTFSEHIWAHDEHKFFYSPRKFKKFVAVPPALLIELREYFSILKFTLLQGDQIRRHIRVWNRDKGIEATWLEQSFELKSRVSFFKTDAAVRFADRLRAADEHIDQRIRESKFTEANYLELVSETLQQIWVAADHYKKRTGEDLLELYPDDYERWGRQRAVLLSIGYLLLFGPDVSISDRLLDDLKNSNLMNLFPAIKYGGSAETLADGGRFTTSLLARRIYEYVYSNDQFALQKFPDNETADDETDAKFFFDPLVYSRLATARYKGIDFAGAFQITYELLVSHPRITLLDWEKTKLRSQPKAEFVGRMVEYIFFHAYSKNYTSLLDNLRVLERVARMVKAAPQPADYVKSYCWFIIMYDLFLLNETALPTEFEQHAKDFESYVYENIVKITAELDFAKKPYFLIAAAICYERRGRVDDCRASLEAAGRLLAAGIPHPQLVVEIYQDIIKNILAALDNSGRTEH